MSAVPDQDWAADTADRIDQLVEAVRSRTTDRLVGVARLVVYGVLGAVMAVMAATLLVIAAIRFLDAYLPRGVWLPYVLLGAILVAAGLFLWSKRSAEPAET
jgi:hypothetical protein